MKEIISKNKVRIIIVLAIIIYTQFPFHIGENNLKQEIIDQVESLEGTVINKEQMNIKTESDIDSIKVLAFTYDSNDTQKKGTAIFVKHMLFPLYKTDNIYVDNGDEIFDYSKQVKNHKKTYIITINEETGAFSIQFEAVESTTREKVSRYGTLVLLLLVIYIVRTKRARAKNF